MQTVLLVGFPNSGKSTIFNNLSGQYRKISNYSGITVDSGMGELKSNKQHADKITIVDLPGIHNLLPNSIDEGVTIGALLGQNKNFQQYQQVAVVLDLNHLQSSLALALALKDLVGEKLLVIINKSDKQNRLSPPQKNLLEMMLGVEVLGYSALSDSSAILDKFIRENLNGGGPVELTTQLEITSGAQEFLPNNNSRVENDKIKIVQSEKEILNNIENYHKKSRKIVAEIYSLNNGPINNVKTQKIDKIVLHPLWGSIIFISCFYLLFHAIYSWATPVMDLMDGQIGALANLASNLLPAGGLRSLVVDGVIAGVGGVVIFLPQIMFLFFLLSLLEQSGYISRAAFLTDRVMGLFGLNGKAFLPYMSGFACSIPAIMSTRTIISKRERMATLMTIPFITCSARLPVYVLLVGTFVPDATYAGVLNSKALAFFFLYFIGSFVALIFAKVFRLTMFKGETGSFFMDLPLYQLPSLKIAICQMLEKAKVFLKKAGTIILGISIIIWFASTYPRAPHELLVNQSEQKINAINLEHSLLGRLGKTIEPVIKPIGFDWKMGIGVLAAFSARELFVSTMGTIYALGDVDEESSSLRQRILAEKDPLTGKPIYNVAVAWSLLLFFAFALQCLSTVAVVKRETGGWYYPLFMVGYMGLLGYISSFVAYNLLR